MIRRIHSIVSIMATAAVVALLSASTPLLASEPLEAALSTIQAEDLRGHVSVLADDSFEGREAGSRGGQAAAKYLALFFEKYDLQPAGESETFYQSFQAGYRNILGLLPGSDPLLQDQIIVIGAHYDHVGLGSRRNSFGPYGVVHNGADDNASGTSALLELVEAFTDLPVRPRRSILFCLWDGEEKGLLGSKHWLQQPTVGLEHVVFSINLDMVGRLRDEGLSVYGERTAPGLRALLSETNADQLKLAFNWDLKADSDHYPFIESGIPTVMMHTGLHDQYHRPTDDIETLNYDGIEAVSRYVGRVAWAIAEQPDALEFRSESRGESEATRVEFERRARAFPTRLGVALSEVEQGVQISDVLPGSAAQRAGLQTGARLVKVDEHPVTSAAQFWDHVFAAEKEVALTVQNADEMETSYRIQLDGRPLRIGISWRMDPAHPGIALISRVCPNSRAARAGLESGDRLYRVNGQPIRSELWLAKVFAEAAGQVRLTVEASGRIDSRVLELPEAPPADGIVARE